MKRVLLFVLSLIIGSGLIRLPVNASVNDFYFSDFTGDYYLSQDAEGISHLKVVESVTAVFPNFNQNKGICRQIPFTNQNKTNITLPNLTRENIKIMRNGEAESIYSIERGDDYYDVCTGTEEYVLGEQIYVFEYEFSKVVTEFTEKGRTFQELYWDANGNGAMQRFDSVTARLHFDDKEVFTGDSWCYVGYYGESGQDRCTITEIDDGVQFSAKELKSRETLTFDVELKPNSFTVPGPEEDYTYVWLTLAIGVISLVFIGVFFRKYRKTREKANYYKEFFVKPEYQPNNDYSLAEMSEIYLDKKKDVKVAMLLEMVVQRKIELKKTEKKKWEIIVKEEINGEYADLLAILNDGTKPAVGDTIEIKRRSASSKLISLRKAMENKILGDLKKDELVESNYNIGGSAKRGFSNVIAMTIVVVPVVVMIGIFILGMLADVLGLDMVYGKEMIFEEDFYMTAFIIIVLTVMICVYLSDKAQRYESHTKKGLEMARYMDGMKLYIEMAEADRMKMLQSVEGADTSAEGIVKLYEKLLPYAAVFGLEESWMKEMKEYCEVEEIEEPDYLLNGLAISEISRGLHNVASYATTASTMSSSGGGSSSGFSGGGGGVFSGGGGGGGGFSGR